MTEPYNAGMKRLHGLSEVILQNEPGNTAGGGWRWSTFCSPAGSAQGGQNGDRRQDPSMATAKSVRRDDVDDQWALRVSTQTGGVMSPLSSVY